MDELYDVIDFFNEMKKKLKSADTDYTFEIAGKFIRWDLDNIIHKLSKVEAGVEKYIAEAIDELEEE